ncbi:MFS transporter [Staphylococcus cohnii]|uniref:MFS transporter n=1 Tax=Staphylococcus cohnii TaxID=29382 RepID=UPI000E6772B4|nr:MFS transporter [Staphylococcus cohnii]RIL80774.1 MFS transporter [Staphylococcus cohnii]
MTQGYRMLFFVFMLGTFTIGMTEYVVTGLLTQIAKDMSISVSSAGLLISVYAISVAVLGPIVRSFTLNVSPKKLLPILILIFIFSNMIAMLAPTFNVLLLSRFLSASMHAPFFGVCMSVGAAVVPKGRETGAIALVQAGLTIAVMLGVPFGAFIGGVASWRIVFGIIVAIGVIVLIGLFKVIPNVSLSSEISLKQELKVFKNPYFLLVISIVIFGYSGVFTTYTFMEPMIQQFSPFNVSGLTLCLLAFGIGAVIGNIISGKASQENLTKYLSYVFIFLIITLMLLTYALGFAVTAIVICFMFGFANFGSVPLLNSKIILSAKEAPLLSSTLAASVFNVANFLGAIIGTLLLNAGVEYVRITFISSGIILIGIILNLFVKRFENKNYTV